MFATWNDYLLTQIGIKAKPWSLTSRLPFPAFSAVGETNGLCGCHLGRRTRWRPPVASERARPRGMPLGIARDFSGSLPFRALPLLHRTTGIMGCL